MNLLLTGATGFLGRPLCRALAERGHSLTVLTRDPSRAAGKLPPGTRALAWEPLRQEDAPDVVQAIVETDAVINLAGESIAGRRWTPEYKERLFRSRLDSTRAVVAGLAASGRTGLTLVNASAVGYYGDRGEETVMEESPPGRGFLPDLCAAWEAEARKAESAGVRVALPRIGMVLGEGGGALQKMAAPYRFGAGGPLGSGRQWISWIHRDDVVGMLLWALESPAVRGPVNLTAPEPVTMREFACALGKALRRPAFMPVPGFALRLLVGEFAEWLLTGQKAIPAVGLRLGYVWQYPHLEPALRAIFRRE
jgi:uncharacterized protein (TIGR01777 family)